ncbi:MAG: hypothetical protein GXP31_00945 [Kiritimatiellaeota bacterium]|nr:hypothetical protein [Kiritimatiellota bacterium]
MKTRFPMRFLFWLILGLMRTDAVGVPARKPAVLFVGNGGGRCGFRLARKLAAAGFVLDVLPRPALSRAPLTWERARHFNVIVVEGLGRANADSSLPPRVRETLEVLGRFLEAGGGVLVLPYFGQQLVEKPPQDAFLIPLGLTPLFDEMPSDPTAVAATAWKLPFAWADDVAPAPATAGVNGLWFPVPDRRVGAQNHTNTFKADSRWSVLVRGGAASFTRKGKLQENAPKAPGTYASRVPLVASREVGKGRVVYVGITHEYLTGPNAWTTLEGIVLERGLRERPSGGYRLIANSLKWLAAPSLAAADLGGAPGNPSLERDPQKTRFGKPFRWTPEPKFPTPGKPAPGVVGARTRYSTGRASADEWVAAAKNAGLAFLVFLEDFSRLSPRAFQRLKADCARLSGEDFAAVPGFAIDDNIGNHYFYFGSTFPYPDAKFLSPDGRTFRSRDAELAAGDPYIDGQLSMTTLNYAYATCGFKLTAGNCLFSDDAAPFSDFFSNWDAFAVTTGEDGKLLEDALPDYLAVVDSGQGPVPLAVDFLSSPKKLKDVSRRTVLCLAPDRPVGPQVREYFDSWRLYPDNPLRCFVTAGPTIREWAYAGPRDYEGNTRGNFVWQNYRWRLQGEVGSETGLSEVSVFDGPNLFRRYLPGGAKSFSFELDLTHDRQHNLVLIALDKNGKRAVSREQWDRNHRLEEFMCSDRNNQLSYGYVTATDGVGLLLGGNQSLATPFKRIAGGISPAGTFKNDPLLGAPAFDGAAGGEPQVWENTAPLGVPGNLPAHTPNVNRAVRLFHSGDVHVGEGRREFYFTDGIRVANVWHTLGKTAPADAWTVCRRNTFFQVDPDSPLAVFLWRIDLKLLKDLPNRGFEVIVVSPAESLLWMLRSAGGRQLSGMWEGPPRSAGRSLIMPFGPGAYAAFLGSPLGGCAVFTLAGDLEARLGLPRRSSLRVRIPQEKAPARAGETRRVELLLVGLPRQTDRTARLPALSNEIVERFYREFGLDGGPGGYTVAVRAGRIAGRRYILRVDGAADNGFAGMIEGDLVSALPVRVAGLNDRWSAVLYDAALGKARPVGVFENAAWAVFPLHGRREVFIGHPVTAGRRELFVQVTQTGNASWRVEVHNPTDTPLRTSLVCNRFFPPFQVVAGLPKQPVTVPAGGSEWFILHTDHK